MQRISVLVSVYRKEKPEWFREALDSVFAQTLQPDEIVLVEDGPLTPELYDVIDRYQKEYPIFTIIVNETNIGLGLSLQKGVLAAKNEVIARMDTDDLIPPDRFSKQIDKINDGYDVVSCWSELYSSDMKDKIALKKRPEFHEDIVKLAHKRSPVCHAACIMKKSAIIEAGNYQHCKLYEDYHLWARMIMSGAKFYNVQEVLYYVRTTPEQFDRRSGYDYLKTELSFFKDFYKMGFFTTKDYVVNSAIRICTRLAPKRLRKAVLRKVWNHK